MKNFTHFSQNRFTGENYKEIYLKSSHWHQLTDKEIYSNPTAKCYIDEVKYSLLLHHCRYDNLFHEKLGRDVFILCYDCHNNVHFSKLFIFFTRKTKLKKKYLLRRMYYLRLIFCIRNRRFIPAIKALLLYTLTYAS